MWEVWRLLKMEPPGSALPQLEAIKGVGVNCFMVTSYMPWRPRIQLNGVPLHIARQRGRPRLEADAEQVVVAGQAVLKL